MITPDERVRRSRAWLASAFAKLSQPSSQPDATAEAPEAPLGTPSPLPSWSGQPLNAQNITPKNWGPSPEKLVTCYCQNCGLEMQLSPTNNTSLPCPSCGCTWAKVNQNPAPKISASTPQKSSRKFLDSPPELDEARAFFEDMLEKEPPIPERSEIRLCEEEGPFDQEYVDAAVFTERERCAKVAESFISAGGDGPGCDKASYAAAGAELAAKIRSGK